MDISSVLSTVGVVATETTTKSSNISQNSEVATQAEDSYSSKLAEIAAKYDPTNIPLSEIDNLVKDLYKTGLIQGDERALLMGLGQAQEILMRDGLRMEGMNVRDDGTVNLLAYYDSQKSHQSVAYGRQLSEDIYKTLDNVASQLGSSDSASATSVSASSEIQQPLNIHSAISAYQSGINQSTFDSQKLLNIFQAMATRRNENA